MSVLIGGGSGFVGRHLTRMLRDKGYQVTVISRKPKQKEVSWVDIERNGLPTETTAVINVAGEMILQKYLLAEFRANNPQFPGNASYRNFIEETWNSRVNTNKLLVGAITQSEKKPDVFVTMSGVGYYPYSYPVPGQFQQPTSQPLVLNPADTYKEGSRAGEGYVTNLTKEWEAAGDLPEGCPTRRVVVRSGVVLGDGGMIAELYHMYKIQSKLHLGILVGKGDQLFPWIHVKDIAGIFTFAVENDHVTGVLNGVSSQKITNYQFTRAVMAALNPKMKGVYLIKTPSFLYSLMYGKELSRMVLEGISVDPERTKDLGYPYLFPKIDEACRDIFTNLYK